MGRRLPRLVLTALATVVAGAALLLLVTGLVGAFHAAGVRSAAESVRSSIEDGDTSGAAVALRDLERHSAGAGRWLGGPPWTALGWLPVLGDSIAATTELAAALSAVVEPLAAGSADVLEVSGGQPQEAIEALHDRVDVFVAAGREAHERAPGIAAIDAAGLPGPLQSAFTDAQQQFAELTDLATGAAAGAVLLPGLLGLDGETAWLLVASQPAEARGSGAGFFGAVAAMRGSGGAAQLSAVYPNDVFFDEAADLGQLPPQFGELWGESAAYVWAHNLTGHFPYAAQLLRSSTAAVIEPSRYIVAADPTVVAALLTITGPVTAAGVTIDADTAVQYLTRDIYRDFPVGDDKDAVASELLAAAFQAFQTAEYSPVEAATALAAPIAQRRLLAWAADPREQQVLAWTPLAGGVPAPDWSLTAAINNAAGNKLDAYLATDVEMRVQGDCDSLSGGEVTIGLELGRIPPGLPDYVAKSKRGPQTYGGTRLLVHVYGPPGAELATMTVDGRAAAPQRGEELGRPVWGLSIDLVPDQRRTVSAAFAGRWPRQAYDFVAQPMVQPTTVRVVGESCAGTAEFDDAPQ